MCSLNWFAHILNEMLMHWYHICYRKFECFECLSCNNNKKDIFQQQFCHSITSSVCIVFYTKMKRIDTNQPWPFMYDFDDCASFCLLTMHAFESFKRNFSFATNQNAKPNRSKQMDLRTKIKWQQDLHWCAYNRPIFVRWIGAADQFASIFKFEFEFVYSLHISFFKHHIFDPSKMMSSSSDVSTTYASDAGSESDASDSNGSRKSQRLSGINDSGFVTREVNNSDTDVISSTSTSGSGSNVTPSLSSTSSGSSSPVSVIFLRQRNCFSFVICP